MKLVLDDIIIALQLQGTVIMQEEVTVHSLQPNLLVLIHKHYPIGVVEIKTPGSEVLNNSKVHGQMYDYMVRLKMYFGVETVFGIITTYEQWRVFWLHDACGTASIGIKKKEIENNNYNKNQYKSIELILLYNHVAPHTSNKKVNKIKINRCPGIYTYKTHSPSGIS